jgi:hypothetical protein
MPSTMQVRGIDGHLGYDNRRVHVFLLSAGRPARLPCCICPQDAIPRGRSCHHTPDFCGELFFTVLTDLFACYLPSLHLCVIGY